MIGEPQSTSDRSTDQAGVRVLLMGYRSSIGKALQAVGVPFVVWSESPTKTVPPGVTVHVAPFGRTAERSRRHAEALRGEGPFTHVIAATEASVVSASHARQILGARRSTHTTVRRCHDKLLMKRYLRRHGVPMADFVDGNTKPDWGSLRTALGSPLVVKNRSDSGGSGIEIVGDEGGANVTLRQRIVERFVDAPEASVESFVVDGRVVFENVTDYYRKRHVNVLPAPREIADELRHINRRVIEALRISWGVTHAEFFLCREGALFGEIALRPPGGYIMDLMSLAYGFDAWQAFVAVELGTPFDFPDAAGSVAAGVVLHPGAGRVTQVDGLTAIREHPNVVRVKLRARAGDVIDERRNVGKNIGHILLHALDRGAVLAAVADVEARLRITVEPPADSS